MPPPEPARLRSVPPEGDGAAGADLLVDGCVSVAEAAKFTGLGRTSIYAAMDSGELVSIKRGRRRLVPRRALVAWLERGLVP